MSNSDPLSIHSLSCPDCGGAVSPTVLNAPTACVYCDSWLVIGKKSIVSIETNREEAKRLRHGEQDIEIRYKEVSPYDIFWGRFKRGAPYGFIIPYLFTVVCHIGVAFDPSRIRVIPGLGRGEDNLFFPLFFVSFFLLLTGHTLLCTILLYIASASYTGMMMHWLLKESEHSILWRLQSESGIMNLVFIGIPLIIATSWCMMQTKQSFQYHIKKIRNLPIGVHILGIIGVLWSWMIINSPTLIDYAHQYDDQLITIEKNIEKIALQIDSNNQKSTYKAEDNYTFEPTPIFYDEEPLQSNVAFLQMDAVAKKDWIGVYGSTSERTLYLKSELVSLFRAKYQEYNPEPYSEKVYTKSLSADWWVLYRMSKDCDSGNSDVMEAWLIEVSTQKVILSFEISCRLSSFEIKKLLLSELSAKTNGIFED